MPTTNPRFSITLDPADLAVLDRYAKVSGTPRATFISGLIASTIPELERAADLMELAKNAPAKLRRDVVDNLSNATSDALGFLEPFNKDYHTVMSELGFHLKGGAHPSKGNGKGAGRAASGASLRRASGGSPPPSDPHLLTGGSK